MQNEPILAALYTSCARDCIVFSDKNLLNTLLSSQVLFRLSLHLSSLDLIPPQAVIIPLFWEACSWILSSFLYSFSASQDHQVEWTLA